MMLGRFPRGLTRKSQSTNVSKKRKKKTKRSCRGLDVEEVEKRTLQIKFVYRDKKGEEGLMGKENGLEWKKTKKKKGGAGIS